MEGGWRGVYGRRSVFLPLRVLRGRALADRDTMQPPEMFCEEWGGRGFVLPSKPPRKHGPGER